ncbi:DUF4157 domain-containing protein [Streptomyces griseoluteus]|uniref:DUF4157 domain-containing protein n=1 Tax=Streptomyces griseoluteus TaxID=29306 RepID=A0A4Z1CYY2_STRGP|nr:DUF4157 domain-containing protein [Streptomyces griseoluteus]TGN74247.1 DUF4157 domain-containing protein [Streptomyces griseoluteus]GHF33544.1 hypothetical protein GCM10017776_60060 [Streptomyces griseoluteus]
MRERKNEEATGAKVGREARHAPAEAGHPRSRLLALQGTVGNAAVVQMLRRAGHGLDEEEHRHGDGCGHEGFKDPAVQRSSVHDVVRSPGRPLDQATRTDMESRLGADFSDVRIHTGSAANASAAEVGARAYTSGNHVVLAAGGGDAHTLAHELTHVIQQRQGPVSGTDNGNGLRVSDPSDRFEREAEANARAVMSRPAPRATSGVQRSDGPETGTAGAAKAPVQRTLAAGLPKGTQVVKHTDEGDVEGQTILSFGFGSYLISAGADGKKPRASLKDKSWGTVEGREASRTEYEAARAAELDPAVLAAKQKQKDLDLGENYLSADYRRINPLLAALGQVGFTPGEIAAPGFSYKSKESEVLDAWRSVAMARGYADEQTTEAWDEKHLADTFDIFARINGVWDDFATPRANEEGNVVRGDSKHMYESFGGILKQQENHPDGGYVSVDQTIEWPAILSTTYGDPLTHTYVAGKEIVWEFGLPEDHRGRALGRNNQSEEEMTFPIGTKIHIRQILVRSGDFRQEQSAKYGESATVIVFADILAGQRPTRGD